MSDPLLERRVQEELRNRIDEKLENLRDKFAMTALTGITSAATPANVGMKPKVYASMAYDLADAMMERRRQ